MLEPSDHPVGFVTPDGFVLLNTQRSVAFPVAVVDENVAVGVDEPALLAVCDCVIAAAPVPLASTRENTPALHPEADGASGIVSSCAMDMVTVMDEAGAVLVLTYAYAASAPADLVEEVILVQAPPCESLTLAIPRSVCSSTNSTSSSPAVGVNDDVVYVSVLVLELIVPLTVVAIAI